MKAKIEVWYAAGLDKWVAQYWYGRGGELVLSDDTFADDDKADAIAAAAASLKLEHGECDFTVVEC